MCIVSNIGNGWDSYPNTQPSRPTNVFGWPPLGTIDGETLKQFQEVIKRLDAIEKSLGIVDCKDEKKEAFLKELQDLVDKYKAEGKE